MRFHRFENSPTLVADFTIALMHTAYRTHLPRERYPSMLCRTESFRANLRKKMFDVNGFIMLTIIATNGIAILFILNVAPTLKDLFSLVPSTLIF